MKNKSYQVIAYNLFHGANSTTGPLTVADARARNEELGLSESDCALLDVDVMDNGPTWSKVRLWRTDGPRDLIILSRYLIE